MELPYIYLTEVGSPRYRKPRKICVFVQHIGAIQEKFDFANRECEVIGTEIHLNGIPQPIMVQESIKEIMDKYFKDD